MLWGLIVFLGFLFSGILIYESYGDFKDSPILVSITTKPIKGLDFPTVTVCPPKGSTTVLNYDLMKARNFSFTEKERQILLDAASFIFQPLSLHQDYISLMEATTNEENIANIYDLMQSFPKPCGKNCLEIMHWSTEGQIESPWYRNDENNFCENDHMVERELRITLGPPKNIPKGLKQWTLVINLEVNNLTESKVAFREGPEHRFFAQRRNWSDAEQYCKDNDGHLASVGSYAQYQEMYDIIDSNFWDLGLGVWLGGTNVKNNGSWRWSDGTEWGFTDWSRGRPIEENACLALGPDGWYDVDCDVKFSFLCHINPARET